ncbi:efflux RND transporter periplasmic adaptor subunit [Pseudooceanicola sp. HF7]|uniref:efflux RND transporter periplasmic adaptor subunit n=1 Tax=Pseudooceanicola sp. HF7 TaxID=2721560 RepID=UPI0014321062|nr:efflux RND transporter periplasmic adaptor subunit [Pseudooceanicola sp. HF7]NIZ08433.1 efflux RND transporter periplasmic adaptor subunit [Pseudooceanicola sp. HF7]
MTEETPKSPSKPDWALNKRERKAREREEAGLPPKKRRGWLVLVVLVILVGAGGYVFTQTQGQEVAETAEPAENRIVLQLTRAELLEIQPTLLRDTVKVTGSLTPLRREHISSEVTGRLEQVFVRAGDRVEEGDPLIQIDVETLRNQLEQQRATAEATRAQLRLAQNQLDRTQSLVNRGLTASSELERDQAQVDQLQASLKAQEQLVATAESSLDHAAITAPFAGVVSERSVDPGAYVSPGTDLLTIVDLTQLEFEAAAPVRYAPTIKSGMAVELTVEGVGDTQFAGEVSRISPVAIAGTRMLPVFVLMDNENALLRGGMFASGRLIIDEKPGAIGVPYGAVHEDAAGSYVMKKVDDLVERQDIEIARNWDGGRMIEIAEGLQPGDVIVSENLEQLRPGAEIQIVGE